MGALMRKAFKNSTSMNILNSSKIRCMNMLSHKYKIAMTKI